jgi:hypothetical protein
VASKCLAITWIVSTISVFKYLAALFVNVS